MLDAHQGTETTTVGCAQWCFVLGPGSNENPPALKPEEAFLLYPRLLEKETPSAFP